MPPRRTIAKHGWTWTEVTSDISKGTANANELRTEAFPGSCWFRICITCRVVCKGAQFIGNKHSNTQYYILVQMSWAAHASHSAAASNCLTSLRLQYFVKHVFMTSEGGIQFAAVRWQANLPRQDFMSADVLAIKPATRQSWQITPRMVQHYRL